MKKIFHKIFVCMGTSWKSHDKCCGWKLHFPLASNVISITLWSFESLPLPYTFSFIFLTGLRAVEFQLLHEKGGKFSEHFHPRTNWNLNYKWKSDMENNVELCNKIFNGLSKKSLRTKLKYLLNSPKFSNKISVKEPLLLGQQINPF